MVRVNIHKDKVIQWLPVLPLVPILPVLDEPWLTVILWLWIAEIWAKTDCCIESTILESEAITNIVAIEMSKTVDFFLLIPIYFCIEEFYLSFTDRN